MSGSLFKQRKILIATVKCLYLKCLYVKFVYSRITTRSRNNVKGYNMFIFLNIEKRLKLPILEKTCANPLISRKT